MQEKLFWKASNSCFFFPLFSMYCCKTNLYYIFLRVSFLTWTESVHPAGKFRGTTSFLGSVKYVQTASLKNRKVVPDSKPPSTKDVKLLSEFFDRRYVSFYAVRFHISIVAARCFGWWLSLPTLCSKKLVVLTGAGISTECGIRDYRRYFLHYFV